MAEVIGLLDCCGCGDVDHTTTLLDCLHSLCEQCLLSSSHGNGMHTINCPKCGNATVISDRDWNGCAPVKPKAPFSSLDATLCHICVSKDDCKRDQLVAEHWCMECGKALCDGCSADHARHTSSHTVVSLLEASSGASASCRPFARLCSVHSMNINFLCTKCQILRCSAGAAPCVDNGHAVQVLGDKLMADLAQQRTELLHKSTEFLERLAPGINPATKLPDIQRARKGHLDVLQKNKQIVLQEVEKVYNEAANSLNDMYDSLVASTLKAAEEADLLDKKLQHAVAYCKELLRAADAITLLWQEQRLLAHLRSLTDRAKKVQVVDPAQCIELAPTVTTNIHETCKLWLGVPRLLVDIGEQSTNQTEDCELSQLTAIGWLEPPERFVDMAPTADGNLLLATKERGLKEYDASGKVLSCWTPAAPCHVLMVRELNDSSVVVLLDYRSYTQLQLLRRSPVAPDAWLETTCIDEEHFNIFSVHADLLAFAKTRQKDDISNLCPIVLLSLPSGERLLKFFPGQGYTWIRSLAVTSQAIVTVMTEGFQDREPCILKSHGHDGKLLWERKLKDSVRDVCAGQSGRVLYLALDYRHKVIAISAETGQLLGDVLNRRSHDLGRPVRLSLSNGPWLLLAVLCEGDGFLTLYSRTAPTGKKQ